MMENDHHSPARAYYNHFVSEHAIGRTLFPYIQHHPGNRQHVDFLVVPKAVPESTPVPEPPAPASRLLNLFRNNLLCIPSISGFLYRSYPDDNSCQRKRIREITAQIRSVKVIFTPPRIYIAGTLPFSRFSRQPL